MRRAGMGFALFVLCVVIGGYWYITDSERVRGAAQVERNGQNEKERNAVQHCMGCEALLGCTLARYTARDSTAAN
jgi:hypothetical protein